MNVEVLSPMKTITNANELISRTGGTVGTSRAEPLGGGIIDKLPGVSPIPSVFTEAFATKPEAPTVLGEIMFAKQKVDPMVNTDSEQESEPTAGVVVSSERPTPFLGSKGYFVPVKQEIKKEEIKYEEKKKIQPVDKPKKEAEVIEPKVFEVDSETEDARMAKVRKIIEKFEDQVDLHAVSVQMGEEEEADRSRLFSQLNIKNIPDGSYKRLRQEVDQGRVVSKDNALLIAIKAVLNHFPVKVGLGSKGVDPEYIEGEVLERKARLSSLRVDR